MNAITPKATLREQAWTLAELIDANARLSAACGPHAETMVFVRHAASDQNNVAVALYPSGLLAPQGTQQFYGASFAEAYAQAHAWVTANAESRAADLISRMAIAIILLHDEFGEATAAALVKRDFSAIEIAEHHEAAAARANRMAGGRSFAVRFS